MRRLTRILLIALLVVLVVALAGGCAANRGAVRAEGPTAELRVPPAEAVDIRLRQERLPRPARLEPLSVSDESEGRWLTLFEIYAAPPESAEAAPGPTESP